MLRHSLWTVMFTVLVSSFASIVAPSLFSGARAFAADLDLTHAVAPGQFNGEGDRLIYRYSVTNTSSKGLSEVKVTDTVSGNEVCTIGLLSPTYTAECTAYYFVNAADDQAGEVRNAATATAANSTSVANTNGVVKKSGGNNDDPTISVRTTTLQEADGVTRIELQLSKALTSAAQIKVSTIAGTAESGINLDYYGLFEIIRIPAGASSASFAIEVLEDVRVEGNESFTVRLFSPVGVKIARELNSVTIRDNDTVTPVNPTVSIAGATVSEGAGQATLTLRLSKAATTTVSVRATPTSGSAIAGEDFGGAAQQVTFAAGSTSKTMSVSITDDTRVESTENFTVRLSNPQNADLGVSSATVSITDNDVQTTLPTLSVGDVAVSESVGVVQVPVRLSKTASGNVTVNVVSANGSAVAGSDYRALSTAFTFSAGQTVKNVNVTIINDSQNESTESFTLVLGNANGATIADGTGVVTVNDDDASVTGTITASGASVAESIGNASVTVTLSRALPAAASVRYATQSGTATSGADFTGTSGTLTFAAGQTSKQIQIAIADDSAVESSESFKVAFTNPSGAALSTADVTVTINDNDTSGTGVGPQPVAACLQTSATGQNQIVVSPGDNVKAIIDNAAAGAEILIKAGEYRMTQTINPKNNQRLICEDGATFNGSVLLTGTWQLEAATGLYFINNAPAIKPSGGVMQPGREINSILNDLIIDNEVYLRVASKGAVNSNARVAKDGKLLYPGTFYQDGTRLYVASNPNGKKAEMSDVTWAFYAATGFGDNVVMENCTVEKYTGLDISAAIELKQTKGWLLRNVKARLNHTGGMHAGASTTVLCGEYNQNGQTGISTSFAEGNGQVFSFADNLVVNGAQLAYNNWAEYNVQWHAGAMKFFLTDKVTVTNSRVHDNLGVGIWSDFDVIDSVIENNHIYNNLSRAVQIEASYRASVKRNLVQCNTLDSGYSLGWSWFWGSQLFAKNSPEVEIAFNQIDVRDGQGIGIVDNNFRYRGKYDFQQALRNSVHDNTVSYADIAKPGGNNGYQYFFQRSGIESDGPATTGGNGAMNCTPDSTLSDKYSQAEIDAAVIACNARGGYDATASNAENTFFNNTYNYADNYTHFRIRGGSYFSSNIPSPWETGSAFNIGSTARLTNLCN